MKFSDQELQLVREKYGITPSAIGLGGSKTEEGSGYISRVGSSIKKEALGAVKSVQRGADLMSQGKPIQGALRSGLGSAGAAVRAGFSPITEAISPVIAPVVQKLASFVGEDNIEKIKQWAESNPDAAANLQDVFDIGTSVLGAKGAKIGAKTTIKGGKKVVSSIPKPPPGTGKAISGAVEKTGQFLDNTISEASRIPSRMSTNLAERTAKQSTIKSLPSKIAQKAAQDGIDPNDVKFLYKLPKEVKANAKELADVTRKFAAGETKNNPIEIVGKPLVARIKELEAARGKIGQKLGEAAKNLGDVSSEELTPALMTELKKVPGLNGIGLSKSGKLTFKDTSLASGLSKADRTAVQKAFSEAVKAGSGKSKHLLRQELFEILGGKKKSLQAITDTQDKAYDAIRSGLSNVLEGKNPSYKTLSNQYRKVYQPIKDIRKMMKGVAGADDDILDMSAGLLARRLTSNAGSNPQVRSILRAMDKATSKAGKSQVSVEALQDFYNILNKYYDIAAKTGFQGQVKAGIESASGLGDAAIKILKNTMGESPAVRQKALESILKEIL